MRGQTQPGGNPFEGPRSDDYPQAPNQMNPALQQVADTITDFNSVPYQSTHINGGTVMGSDPTTA